MSAGHDIFDRMLLRRRRERIAAGASAHEFLLARLAEDFCDRLRVIRRDFPLALNLGAHHGTLSRHIRRLDNVGMVIDADACGAMLKACDGPCVQMDEELLPFAPASLDLVVSGLAFQFVNDLPGTLAQIHRCLKPDGLMLAGLIGGRSLFELRDAFMRAEEEIEGGASPRVAPFADIRDLGALLTRAGFALPVVDADVLSVTYATPIALMHELRMMGAGNVLKARRLTPLRRATLMRAAEIYAERFAMRGGRVPATFEIITLTGWAPHESQQKPLRPGSAQKRLADALGTSEHPAGEKVRRPTKGS